MKRADAPPCSAPLDPAAASAPASWPTWLPPAPVLLPPAPLLWPPVPVPAPPVPPPVAAPPVPLAVEPPVPPCEPPLTHPVVAITAKIVTANWDPSAKRKWEARPKLIYFSSLVERERCFPRPIAVSSAVRDRARTAL